MAKLCGDQDQIRSAAWFLAFVADHHRLRSAAAAVGEPSEGLGFTEFLLMAIIDAALAAERLVCAAEAIGIGACYIGALRNDPAAVAEELALPQGTFGLCLGYPAGDCTAEIKPRLGQDAVWFREQYRSSPPVAEYDVRAVEYYRAQGMRADANWSQKSGRRVDRNHLSGRQVLRSWLESQGMGTE